MTYPCRVTGEWVQWGEDDIVDYLAQYGPVRSNYLFDDPEAGLCNIQCQVGQWVVEAEVDYLHHWLFSVYTGTPRLHSIRIFFDISKAIEWGKARETARQGFEPRLQEDSSDPVVRGGSSDEP